MSGACPKRRPDVRTEVVGDELVILDVHGEAVHHLNATAAFLWHACDGTLTLPELAQRLTGRFEVDPDTATRDASRMLDELYRLNLLQDGPPTGSAA